MRAPPTERQARIALQNILYDRKLSDIDDDQIVLTVRKDRWEMPQFFFRIKSTPTLRVLVPVNSKGVMGNARVIGNQARKKQTRFLKTHKRRYYLEGET